MEELGVENYKTPNSEYDDSKCVRRLWKLIGDEVLIYVQIRQVRQLYTQILSVNDAMQDMMEKIAEKVEKDINKNYFKDGKISQQNVKEVVLSMLGIKVTAWLAECFNKKIGNFPNIIYYPITTISGNRIDFLGREIDEGFRLAKYAVKNKIIVSPLLAWMIWKGAQQDETENKNPNSDHDLGKVLDFCSSGDIKTCGHKIRYSDGQEKTFSFDNL